MTNEVRQKLARMISDNIKEHLDSCFQMNDECDRHCTGFDIIDMLIEEGFDIKE